MIGGGIFNSPTDLIGSTKSTSSFIIVDYWRLGVIFFSSSIPTTCKNKRPKLTGGIFTYAKEGFGDFTGFNSAWDIG